MAKRKHNAKIEADNPARPCPSASVWIILACVLAALVLVVYWQAHAFEFLLIDDTTYVLENPHVLAGLSLEGAGWAFTTLRAANWHPLTWLSLMIDAQIAGENAGFYHLHNIVLHIAAMLLLFGLLTRMTGLVWRSAFVAALFGIHPLHVESVAWITERKDVLSTVFWMLTTLLHVRYCERPRALTYAAMLAVYALGLMAKPMLVSLPLTLLLLDYWPLRRLGTPRPADRQPSTANIQPYLEKLPLFALAAASCVVTFIAQKAGGAVTDLRVQSVGERAANALVSYAAYITKMFWPSKLAAFYPVGPDGHSVSTVAASAALLIVLSVAAAMLRRRARFLRVGWLWYVLTLVPVIGLVQVGSQAMADRYTYVPLVGLFVAVAWGIPEVFRQLSGRWLAVPAVVVIAALAVKAYVQVGYWRNTRVLAEHAIAVVPNNYKAHFDLGLVLAHEKKTEEAIRQYQIALSVYPNSDTVYSAMGSALLDKGDVRGAMQHARRAVEIAPRVADYHANLGMILLEAGDMEQAAFECSEALRLNPELRGARNNLAYALIQLGRIDDAQAEVRLALESNPRDPDALNNQGLVDLDRGNLDDAAMRFREAISFDAKLAEAHNNLGVVLIRQNRINEGLEQFRRAISLDPRTEYFRRNLERAQMLMRD